MSYADRETSVQDAQPIEIYTFELPEGTTRLTSHDEDVTFDGQTYTAAPISRGNIALAQVGKVRELVVSIARDHALAQAMRLGGVPPIDALMTLRCFHDGDSEARPLHVGFVGGTSIDGEFMRLRVPNRTDETFDRGLPVIVAQRTCPHMLYSRGCGVDEDDFKITPTVADFAGVTIEVSSMSGKPDDWARFGKVVRVTDGEQRSVVAQVGTTLTIDVPFRVLEDGDSLELFAGCDRTLAGTHGCYVKFNNVINFGGEPEMPVGNPTAPTGYGVIVQE